MDQIIPTADGVEYRVEATHQGFTATITLRERLELDPFGGRQVHAVDLPGLALHPSEFQAFVEAFQAALATDGYTPKASLDYAQGQLTALRQSAAASAATAAQTAQAAQASTTAPVGTAVVPPIAPAPAPVTPDAPPAPNAPIVPPAPVADGSTLPGYPATAPVAPVTGA